MKAGFTPHKTITKSFIESSQTRPLQPAKRSDRRKSILLRADLKPRMKVPRDSITKEPPMYYSTRTGSRRVPRRRYPLRPSPDMIQNARRDTMSEFFRSVKIIRASDFERMVDLRTAKLNLPVDIELETDHFQRRTSRCLKVNGQRKPFFICP